MREASAASTPAKELPESELSTAAAAISQPGDHTLGESDLQKLENAVQEFVSASATADEFAAYLKDNCEGLPIDMHPCVQHAFQASCVVDTVDTRIHSLSLVRGFC